MNVLKKTKMIIPKICVKQHIVFFAILCFTAALGFPQVDSQSKLWTPFYITPRVGKQHKDLSNDWVFDYRDQELDISKAQQISSAFVMKRPTSVQWALFQNDTLPHPYTHLNAKKYEFVDRKVWYFKKEFPIKDLDNSNYHFLCFDGLDYFAKIWLNGQLLGLHEGMNGGPHLEVSEMLQENNELIVQLKAANYGLWDSFEPQKNPRDRIKPSNWSGAVGAKSFFPMGIWQGVRLETVPRIHIERPYLVTESLEPHKASISFSTELFVESSSNDHELHRWRNGILSRGIPTASIHFEERKVEVGLEFKNEKGIVQRFDFPIKARKGKNWISKKLDIKEPNLWWPNMLGKPHLYDVSIFIKVNGEIVDTIKTKFGIRKIILKENRAPQYTEQWDNWHFNINGKDVFIRGVNWMPIDVLMGSDFSEYDWALSLAKDAGMQMIRAWGGGPLESDAFYRLCDEKGLMVWQDFTIWHQEVPERPQDVWEEQVVQNIFRLRNHPSLVLWCGGNGFNPFTRGNAATMYIIERNLAMYDPARAFTRTSSHAGSVHIYPDSDPAMFYEAYRFIPFIAENGIHSVSNADGLHEIIDPKEFNQLDEIDTPLFVDTHPEIIHHFVEYNPERVPRMLSRSSHITNMKDVSIEALAEASQFGAAEFYQIVSEAVQSNYPFTTGYLPWVLKRPWPIFSGIMLADGFGQPVIPYYFLKRTYKNKQAVLNLPSLFCKAGDTIPLDVSIIDHKGDNLKGLSVSIDFFTTDFKQLGRYHRDGLAMDKMVFKTNLGQFRVPVIEKNGFILILVNLKDQSGKILSRTFYQLRYTKGNLPLPEPSDNLSPYDPGAAWPYWKKGPKLRELISANKTDLKLSVLLEKVTGELLREYKVSIKNTGKYPAFMTQLSVKGEKRLFKANDNFFWMAPGEERVLELEVKWREEMPQKAYLELSAWNSRAVIKKL